MLTLSVLDLPFTTRSEVVLRLICDSFERMPDTPTIILRLTCDSTCDSLATQNLEQSDGSCGKGYSVFQEREAASIFQEQEATSLFREQEVTSIFQEQEATSKFQEQEATSIFQEQDAASIFAGAEGWGGHFDVARRTAR